MADLATEEARAMSGRPAWRVAAACIKGTACPRCQAPMGARCSGKVTCRERVWAQRANERARAGGRAVDVAVFLDAVSDPPTPAGAVIYWHAGEWRLPSCYGGRVVEAGSLHRAIFGGLVRLSGAQKPEWIITESGAVLAEEWARSRAAQAELPSQPVAPPVDAAAATQAFLERVTT